MDTITNTIYLQYRLSTRPLSPLTWHYMANGVYLTACISACVGELACKSLCVNVTRVHGIYMSRNVVLRLTVTHML